MPDWVLFPGPTDFLRTGDGVPGQVIMGWEAEVWWGIGTGRLWAMQMKRRRPKAIKVSARVAQVPLDTQHQAHSLTGAFDEKETRDRTGTQEPQRGQWRH